MTDKKEAMLSALIDCHCIVTDASLKADVSRKSHYEWLLNDPEYKKAVEELQETAIDYVEGKLFKLIDGENPTGILFYLKTKGKSRGYSETETTIVNNEIQVIYQRETEIEES